MIDPTPAVTHFHEENEFATTTRCLRYEVNHDSKLPLMSIEESLCINPRCQTRSNALEISQKTALTSFPSSSAWQISLYKDNNSVTGESPFTKPDF